MLTESHEVAKFSLLLSCCRNNPIEKPHEAELRKLEGLLEDNEEFEGMYRYFEDWKEKQYNVAIYDCTWL